MCHLHLTQMKQSTAISGGALKGGTLKMTVFKVKKGEYRL